jgi:hypothetical protein
MCGLCVRERVTATSTKPSTRSQPRRTTARGSRTRTHRTQLTTTYFPRIRGLWRRSAAMREDFDAPDRIRTYDPRLRRPLLCPTELRAQKRSTRSSEGFPQSRRAAGTRIGALGFEPRASCSQSRRANRAALRPAEHDSLTGGDAGVNPLSHRLEARLRVRETRERGGFFGAFGQ